MSKFLDETGLSYFWSKVKTYVTTQLASKQNKLVGTAGQIVGFNASGEAVAQAVPTELPSGGTAGQVLTKTEDGTEWADASKPLRVSVTLTTAGWAGSAAPYSQTVSVSGILADETAQLITPVPALASQSAYYEAGVLCTGQAANSLTFTCETVPTSDLTVYVVIQEVGS